MGSLLEDEMLTEGQRVRRMVTEASAVVTSSFVGEVTSFVAAVMSFAVVVTSYADAVASCFVVATSYIVAVASCAVMK